MNSMPADAHQTLAKLVSIGQSCASGLTEIVQRVIIIAADLLLILFAIVAIGRDWKHSCDEKLHSYGFLCVMLCILDMAFEFVRCTLESSLDRLQADFQPDVSTPAGQGNEGLLGSDPFAGGLVGQARLDTGEAREVSPGGPASIGAGTLGRGIRKEKASRQKRTSHLHRWSIVFTCLVSIVFSFFSAHDADCAKHAPHLNAYIHTFTYVFIIRLGAVILWICCRTVKNYEDAANSARARQQGTALRPLSF